MATKKFASDETVANHRTDDPASTSSDSKPHRIKINASLGSNRNSSFGSPLRNFVETVLGPVASLRSSQGLGEPAGTRSAGEIDTAMELHHWRSIYAKQPYYSSSRNFYAYEPAYRAGVEAYDPSQPMSWEERETMAKDLYESRQHTLNWNDARVAARDAYNRLYNRFLADH